MVTVICSYCEYVGQNRGNYKDYDAEVKDTEKHELEKHIEQVIEDFGKTITNIRLLMHGMKETD